ncbi:hypothetical protein RJ640_001670, partial [Escallonia rubra]
MLLPPYRSCKSRESSIPSSVTKSVSVLETSKSGALKIIPGLGLDAEGKLWRASPASPLQELPFSCVLPTTVIHLPIILMVTTLNRQFPKPTLPPHHNKSNPQWQKLKGPLAQAFSETETTTGKTQFTLCTFAYDCLKESEEKKTLFDAILSNSIGKKEGSAEKKLRETGEWILDRTESSSRSSGWLEEILATDREENFEGCLPTDITSMDFVVPHSFWGMQSVSADYELEDLYQYLVSHLKGIP